MQRDSLKCSCFINSNSLVGARKVAPGSRGAHTTTGVNKQNIPLFLIWIIQLLSTALNTMRLCNQFGGFYIQKLRFLKPPTRMLLRNYVWIHFSLYLIKCIFFAHVYELKFKTKFGTQMADKKPMPDARTSFGIFNFFTILELPDLRFDICLEIYQVAAIYETKFFKMDSENTPISLNRDGEMKDKYKPHSYIGFYVPQVVIFLCNQVLARVLNC
jgi:hypothetical protein